MGAATTAILLWAQNEWEPAQNERTPLCPRVIASPEEKQRSVRRGDASRPYPARRRGDATGYNISGSKICTKRMLSGAGVMLCSLLASLPYPCGVLST